MKAECYLPIRPRPQTTESGLGYVLRLMQANGYPLSSVIWDFLKGRYRERRWAWHFPVTELSSLVCGHREELERISYLGSAESAGGKNKRAYKILDHELGMSCGDVARSESPVVCPECVREQGFIDAFFDLRVAVACPEHRVFVVRACPHCKAPLVWARRGLLTCKCGGELSRGGQMPAPESLVHLLAVVKARLHGVPIEGVAREARFPLEFMARVKLVNLLRLLMRLGRIRLEFAGELDPADDRILESGSYIFSDWPNNFHGLLQQFGEREVAGGRESHGIFKQFWGFIDPLLRRLKGDPTRSWVHAQFIEFARSSWGGLYERGESKGGRRQFVSLETYAGMTGMCCATIRRLIRDGVLKAKIYQTGRRKATVIDTRDGDFLAARHAAITRQAASRELGISVPLLDKLRKSGVFRVKEHKTLSACAKRRWCFPEDVEAFRQRILGCRRDQAPEEKGVGFIEMIGRGGMRLSVKHAVIAAMLGGKIAVVGPPGARLNDLFLLRAEIRELCRGLMRDAYSFNAAAALLRIKYGMLRKIIKAGLLEETRGKFGRRVTAQSVNKFRAERLMLGQFARQHRTRRATLELVCRDLGIEILSLSKSKGERELLIIPRGREQEMLSALQIRQHARRYVRGGSADKKQRDIKSLQKYLEELRSSGKFLPRCNGVVSLRQVAKNCQFHLSVWKYHPRLKELLQRADKEECSARGLEGPGPAALLRGYLRQLAERDEPLPMRPKGAPAPSETAIGRLAGIKRGTFGRFPELRALVQDYRNTWEARHPELLPLVRAGRAMTASQRTDSV